MGRWRSFSSAVSPVWLSRFLARSLCLLFSRFVGISLARSPCGSRSLARWIHSFALSLARSRARSISRSSLSRSLSLLLSRFLVVSLSRSLACTLSRSLTILLSRWFSPSPALALLRLLFSPWFLRSLALWLERSRSPSLLLSRSLRVLSL